MITTVLSGIGAIALLYVLGYILVGAWCLWSLGR
ncbi:hypothetical protein SEA_OCTOBIEN14_104 [Gordonia phage Octobien14]|uniref:Uncharacterized protein n=1 Tax=Gordonia phage Octobien14 TaxID=2483673 RepID=A0A3G3MA47_9CAUD|nr:hypothetical protein L3Y22_gp139 [Gordonia phage Octobien14]AYR03283.1 hypothetical protein SEA_OCTOBIEN14_104 [Gordonia phage Octobien14]